MKKWSAKNKKALLLCGLFLAVIAAGYANYLITTGGMNGDVETGTQAQNQGEDAQDVFAVFKQERQTTRTQEISYIDSVVSSTETDEKTKDEAQKQKLALVANMENELLTEGVIKTKISADAVVTIQEDAVNVVVDKTELSDSEVAAIAEIVKSQTGQPASNIKIMPKA